MSPSLPWSRRTVVGLTAFACLGAVHAAALAVLAWRDGRAGVLAGLALAYTLGAAGSARALRQGQLGRAARWLALWAVAALGGVGLVGGAFRPGPLFWWSSAGALLTWGSAGVWIGRRVVREATAARGAALGGAPPAAPLHRGSTSESLQLPEPQDTLRAPQLRRRGSATELQR